MHFKNYIKNSFTTKKWVLNYPEINEDDNSDFKRIPRVTLHHVEEIHHYDTSFFFYYCAIYSQIYLSFHQK